MSAQMDGRIRPAIEQFGYPPYWLIFGKEWPEGASEMAWAALAVAPVFSRRVAISREAADVIDVADAYVAQRRPPGKVVYFSDLTRWLDDFGQTWGSRSVDWERVIDELDEGLRLELQVSSFSHMVLCNASRAMTIHIEGPLPPHINPDTFQWDIRQAFAGVLERDWPPYVARFLADQPAEVIRALETRHTIRRD
jgi:hypothetical protein